MERRTFALSLGALLVTAVAGIVSPTRKAEARVGRPASPGSVSGVHRRHRRRRRVVIGMSVYSLPAGCTARVRGGVTYQYCGGAWYQPVYQGTQVVYVVQDIDEGAEPYIEE